HQAVTPHVVRHTSLGLWCGTVSSRPHELLAPIPQRSSNTKLLHRDFPETLTRAPPTLPETFALLRTSLRPLSNLGSAAAAAVAGTWRTSRYCEANSEDDVAEFNTAINQARRGPRR